MATFDLKTKEGLAAACEHVKETQLAGAEQWMREVSSFLTFVRDADVNKRSTEEFQKQLWENNPIARNKVGTRSVHMIRDGEFSRWFAEQSLRPVPEARDSKLAYFTELHDALIAGFKGRAEHFKIFRTLAALFPDAFTPLFEPTSLARVLKAMGAPRIAQPVERHLYVRERIDEALPAPATTMEEKAWRLRLPWLLYQLIDKDQPSEKPVSHPGNEPGQSVLEPLPAARRRRGLTAVSGLFQTVLGLLDFAKDGVTRQELLDYLRSLFPTLKDSSLGTAINVFLGELGVIRLVDGKYVLSDHGAATLESGEASELGDWLLTRVLGIDHVVNFLQEGRHSRAEVLALLQRVNPGWTTTFAPSALVSWLVSMNAIRRFPNGDLELDQIGVEWAERITWEPEFLPKVDDDEAIDEASAVAASPAIADGSLALPKLAEIVATVTASGSFPISLVEQLHIGLWGSHLRHFVVLAGISGSGKTMLAHTYARALQAGEPEGERRLLIEPVQPGWHDPSPLLGYLNPLGSEGYVRTPFLEFLIRAAQDPTHPYVVILDEMNLSRPEQYFAPLLSRMETGGRVHLHSEGDVFDGVPSHVVYPRNLAIIGTVNMDETTHGLSDKVLDRAFTIEFWDIDLDTYPRWGQRALDAQSEARVRAVLSDFMTALSPAKLHFGWRTVDDILNYMDTAQSMGASTAFADLLDAAVFSKLLPKMRGEDSDRFRHALTAASAAAVQHGLHRSAQRLKQLTADLDRAGSAHFWR
jgi:MoxR-like ATPase